MVREKTGGNIKCKECQLLFYAPKCNEDKIFCSSKCYHKYKRDNPNTHPNYKDGRCIITCPICKKTVHKQNKTFCSHKCYGKHKSVVRCGEGNTFYGKKHTDKTKQIIGTNNHNAQTRPGMREWRSNFNKQYYKQHPEKHPNRVTKNRLTSIEKKIRKYLQSKLREGIDFEHNKTIKLYDGVLFPDFVIKNKLIIEADGTYWHRDNEKDIKRDIRLKNAGYKILHLKEFDINNKFEEICGRIDDALIQLED